jgi:hypothetical protein
MKYRIFDLDDNKYVTEHTFVNHEGNVMGYCASGNWAYNHHKTVVELSTGLLDKNGVEIYEGDTGIVDTGIYRSNLEKIVYKQGAYFCGDGLFNKFVANNFERIGNIHDTPREGE